MSVSQAQIMVWKARAQLDRKLAKMTPAEAREYLAGAQARLEAKTGVRLHLQRAPLTRRRRAKSGSAA